MSYLSALPAAATPRASSSLGAAETPGALTFLKRAQKPGASAIVGAYAPPGALTIERIEARRRAAGISLSSMLAEARVNERTYRRSRRDKGRFRQTTLQRLDRALDRLVVGERADGNRAAIGKLYLFTVGVFASACGADVKAVLAMAMDFAQEKPQEEAWLAGARVRRIAMYFIADVLALGNAALGRAIGCTRQNVKQAVKSIEALRDGDPELDALIARVAAMARVG